MTGRPLRLLHLHSTFAPGGPQVRACQLMNAWGPRFEHVIVSSEPGELGARALLNADVPVSFPDVAPPLKGSPGMARLKTLARFLEGHDLVLTYNWGAIDAVMANRLFGKRPLVHHEDGFNSDEAVRLNRRRSLYRFAALGGADSVIVPSKTLRKIARATWRVPQAKLHNVPNGVDLARYSEPRPDAIPGLEKGPDTIVVGTIAGLRPVKRLDRLVRAFAEVCRDRDAKLVIAGSGPEEQRIRKAAATLGIGGQLVMPGFLPEPSRYVGLFDIFAISSDSEQFPISLVEAMAARRPVVATNVGDVSDILSGPNRAMVVPVDDEYAFADKLSRLVLHPELRHVLGHTNRQKVEQDFTLDRMIARYEALYRAAAGR